MKNTLKLVTLTLLCLAWFSPTAADAKSDPDKSTKLSGKGKIEAVVLYRKQALVTRSIQLPKSKVDVGPLGQFVVTDLPPSIIQDTLFAEGDGKVQIQSVRYETKAVKVSQDPEIKKLTAERDQLLENIAEQNAKLELIGQRKKYLDKMEGFVTGTGKVEMSKGVLNAETMERMFSFTTKERQNLMTESLAIKKAMKELQDQLTFVQRKMAEKSTVGSKTVRQAVVYYRRPNNVAAEISLSYLVNNCGWSPSYSVRAFEEKENLDLEYSGMIRQFTGEDWEGVSLTLSTASPAMSAASPGVAPFRITLSRHSVPSPRQVANGPGRGAPSLGSGGGAGGGYQGQDLDIPYPQGNFRGQSIEINQAQIAALVQKKKQEIVDNRNVYSYQGNLETSFKANSSANKIAEIALNITGKELQTALSQADDMDSSLSLNYKLDDLVTLTSRTSQQMVSITKTSLGRKLYYVATPLLTRQVFREAEVQNTSEFDFLSGPVTVYLNTRYVGRAELATVARGQTFVVGLGSDPQLRSARRFLSRNQKTQGGNRVIDMKYVAVVENFKKKPVPVRIYDRIPNSKMSSQVKVSTHELETPLSTDNDYQKVEKPMGILRWDVEIAAASSGEKSFEIPFGYSIEHDRNYMVTTKAKDDAGLKVFDELQRRRNRK